MNRISQTGKPLAKNTLESLRGVVENEIKYRERFDTNEDQIFSDGNRSPETSEDEEIRPKIDNFFIEESKRNRLSGGITSMTSGAFKSNETIKN